jgi:Uma2 family endonuclease
LATATLRLGPADHGRAMSLRDFLDAEVQEGYRYELARGVLEVSEIPDDPHGVLVWNLLCAPAAYGQARPGVIYRAGGGAEFQLLVPEMISGRHPDVAVALLVTPKNDRGRRPASFAVEIVSPGTEARERDYVTKREGCDRRMM